MLCVTKLAKWIVTVVLKYVENTIISISTYLPIYYAVFEDVTISCVDLPFAKKLNKEGFV